VGGMLSAIARIRRIDLGFVLNAARILNNGYQDEESISERY